jgi:hypothetical protein
MIHVDHTGDSTGFLQPRFSLNVSWAKKMGDTKKITVEKARDM